MDKRLAQVSARESSHGKWAKEGEMHKEGESQLSVTSGGSNTTGHSYVSVKESEPIPRIRCGVRVDRLERRTSEVCDPPRARSIGAESLNFKPSFADKLAEAYHMIPNPEDHECLII